MGGGARDALKTAVTLWCAVFTLLHSRQKIHLTDGAEARVMKQLARRLLPPQLFFLSALAMLVLHFSFPGAHFLGAVSPSIGAALIALGISVTLSGSTEFSRIGTNIQTFKEPELMVTEGIFRHTRNPMYLGMCVTLLGFAVFLGSVTPFGIALGFFTINAAWYVPFEEARMRAHFDEEYEHYCQRTRRWI